MEINRFEIKSKRTPIDVKVDGIVTDNNELAPLNMFCTKILRPGVRNT